MSTHTRTIPEWLTGDRVGTIVSPTEAAELPIGALVVRDHTEVYRVGPRGGMRLPLSNDPADRRISLPTLAFAPRASLKVVSVDGLPIAPHTLDELPDGAMVEDRDGDLWAAVDVDGKRGWVYTYDRSARRAVERYGRPWSSSELSLTCGPVTGTDLVPGSCATPTPVGGLYPTTEDADRADSDRFDDPDTTDNSLDLDDLYRATPATIVVDSDGDLWRRQVADDGAWVWVLVVENGVARPVDLPAAAVTSGRLNYLFGPIAYAPAEDAKDALALIPRDVGSVLGGGDPAPADSSLDPDDADSVVEYALNRARVALTGEGEHVVVSITRDSDGRVTARTEVTEQVGGQL